ncbi:MAG TPA: 4-hydroxythreonine-4-phosphate dehydrogenase PdxA, partial [Rhodothermales bacterium]
MEANLPRPRIGVTLGDTNGIGPEVVIKALVDRRIRRFMEPIVFGSPHVLRAHAEKLNFRDLQIRPVDDLPDEPVSDDSITVLDVLHGEEPAVEFGRISKDAGRVAMRAVEDATDLCAAGKLDAIVTAPISKEAISRAGYRHPGHTEFIAERVGCEQYTMLMVSGDLRVGLVTGHIPIWDVPKAVSTEAIVSKIEIINACLALDFGITRPKIGVLGLNPHAGDGGVLGREEMDAIIPAIRQACDQGSLVFGPYPADGFFAIRGYRAYDAVLAMYHDQGLVPFKTIAFESGVNYTAGLPIVRTSPDHGTAHNIAGEGKASAES